MTRTPQPTTLEQSLYGLMAYRELTTFERLSSDARFSPTLADRAALAQLAVTEFGHFELVCEALTASGCNPESVMEPFMEIIDELHERTRPGDWHESLMKAYVLDAVSADFYRAAADRLSDQVRLLAGRIQELDEQTAWLTGRLRADIEDERLRSRLALWGRRLLGEALTKARFVLDTTDLGALLGPDERQELFADLIRRHSRRMSVLGLTA
ncbi:ferritin-like fold-containing protein [Zhihengliuella salsuginis]|uniref:Ferritin-like domain-containing protein n=1 Tax=Zhihengliuella salsuginis TaxID=578222 RepID=A0ABQ3GG73_9MICC|nr:ferritin-like fold-containing protein [Zhihengliuella salsuginis]GHD03732.1 hypothetical protein GCM10008096_10140 [Zhihengliuella salsuginis]